MVTIFKAHIQAKVIHVDTFTLPFTQPPTFTATTSTSCSPSSASSSITFSSSASSSATASLSSAASTVPTGLQLFQQKLKNPKNSQKKCTEAPDHLQSKRVFEKALTQPCERVITIWKDSSGEKASFFLHQNSSSSDHSVSVLFTYPKEFQLKLSLNPPEH